MNAFVLILPLLLIRFGLLGRLNKEALRRAAFFAPVAGGERVAYWVYQLATLFMFLYPLFCTVQWRQPLFFVGLGVYVLGLVVCILATIAFAKPKANGIIVAGVYRVSRNPMYVGYFVLFFGCALLAQSWLLLAGLLVFQVAAHWVILAEERWCTQQFGQEYEGYMKKVRRYI